MHKILVAIDGSDNAARALQFAITLATGSKGLTELHVLNVQPAITFGGVKKFISQEAIDAYYQEEAEKQMHAARQALESSGLPHTFHVGIGHAAETIATYAKQHQCTQIIMGTRGHGAMSGVLLGSVTHKIIHLAEAPVTLVK